MKKYQKTGKVIAKGITIFAAGYGLSILLNPAYIDMKHFIANLFSN